MGVAPCGTAPRAQGDTTERQSAAEYCDRFSVVLCLHAVRLKWRQYACVVNWDEQHYQQLDAAAAANRRQRGYICPPRPSIVYVNFPLTSCSTVTLPLRAPPLSHCVLHYQTDRHEEKSCLTRTPAGCLSPRVCPEPCAAERRSPGPFGAGSVATVGVLGARHVGSAQPRTNLRARRRDHANRLVCSRGYALSISWALLPLESERMFLPSSQNVTHQPCHVLASIAYFCRAAMPKASRIRGFDVVRSLCI